MHFIVYSNFDREKDIEVIESVIKYLKSHSGATFTLASYRESGFLGHAFLRFSDCVKEADAVIVVGGDGTVLRAANDIATACLETPILAINRGVCGFLTDTEPDELIPAIERVISGDYTTDRRLIFKVAFKNKTFYAINEVIVYKGEITKPIVIDASYDDGKHIASTQADGAYVCTPTGSTAYALSAGGPVLAPDTNAILLGAICAHTLVSKPIVLADSHTVTLRLAKEFNDARLMIDGQVKSRIYDDSPVVIRKSKLSAVFIKTKSVDFYKKLLEKLNRWTFTVYPDKEDED